MGTLVQFQRLCSIFNSSIVSINSAAENNFVLSALYTFIFSFKFLLFIPDLAQAADPTAGTIMIGYRLGWGAYPDFWMDGSPIGFGGNTAGGVSLGTRGKRR